MQVMARMCTMISDTTQKTHATSVGMTQAAHDSGVGSRGILMLYRCAWGSCLRNVYRLRCSAESLLLCVSVTSQHARFFACFFKHSP